MTKPIEDTVESAEAIPENLAATLAEIDDLIERDRATKEAAKKHGISVAAIKAEIARRKKRASLVPLKAPAPSIEKLAGSARAIIDSECARAVRTAYQARDRRRGAQRKAPDAGRD